MKICPVGAKTTCGRPGRQE